MSRVASTSSAKCHLNTELVENEFRIPCFQPSTFACHFNAVVVEMQSWWKMVCEQLSFNTHLCYSIGGDGTWIFVPSAWIVVTCTTRTSIGCSIAVMLENVLRAKSIH